jgi:hypothetical protein
LNKTEPRFTKTAPAIPVAELRQLAEGWLLDGDIRQHSERTQGNRREIVDKLLWFLDDQHLASCGLNELRKFFAYLTRGHEDPRGRWGHISRFRKKNLDLFEARMAQPEPEC